MSTEGVLYIALGLPYLVMALNSAQSFRATNPDRGITILTDIALPPEVALPGFDPAIDRWISVDDEVERNRSYKTSADRFADYDRTLLLDVDTVVLADLDVPFRLLDFADALILPHPKGVSRPWQRDEPILDLGAQGDVPSWNGGVVFFRRGEGARDLFRRWNEGFVTRGSKYDGPSLVEAVLTSTARVLPLDVRWNSPYSRFMKSGGTEGPTQILHYMSTVPEWVAADLADVATRLEALGVPVDRNLLAQEVQRRTPPTPAGSPSMRQRLIQGLLGIGGVRRERRRSPREEPREVGA